MKIYEIGTGYTSIPAKMGAATEIVVAELATAFRHLGQEVEIVDIKDKNRPATDLPITEVYMPQFFSSTDVKLGLMHKLKRVLYSISLARKLRQLVKNRRGEKIVLHFHNQYNLFFFLKLAPQWLRQAVTIAYTVHSYVWFGKWDEIKETVRRRYFQEVYCCQNADKVFVLNDIVADMLQEHCNVAPQKIVKVINGVNVHTYNRQNVPAAKVAELKEKYNLAGKKVVFQVGSVCDRKNQLGTLKLLLPVMKAHDDVAMIYAGGVIEPEYAAQITETARKEGVGDRVLYMGEVAPGHQLNELYAMADVAVMNSRSEAFPLVIAEALSASTPIFICDNIMRNLSLWGENEGNGIVRIGDGFAADLMKMFTDEGLYRSMQERGRKFIVGQFSWEVAAKMYVDAMSK